jgi:low temperature requirement protein LtrA
MTASVIAIVVPKVSGPLATLLAGPVGLVIVVVALVAVLAVGWAWEVGPPWFTRRFARVTRYGVVPLLVMAAAATTLIRLFALS